MDAQPSLFDLPAISSARRRSASILPEGLAYQPELISADDEAHLVSRFTELPFSPFQFHGYEGNRRVVSFGWRYDFARAVLEQAELIPDFLLPLRQAVAVFSGQDAEAFQQALVIEYAPGAGIGWHRDRSQFETIAGVSFLAPCPFRFRRKRGDGWERATLEPAPRSAYCLSGPARNDWEHSIPPVDQLRYSVTFRTFRARAR